MTSALIHFLVGFYMLYQIINGRVMFAADTILEHVDFEVKNKNEKIAVIGRNGAGKTTLLKVITGEVELAKVDDEDSRIIAPGNPQIGYLKQITFDDLSLTLDDEIRKVFAKIISMKNRIDELVEEMDACTDTDRSEKLAAEYTKLMDDFVDIGGYYYEKEYDVMLKSFGFCMEDKLKKLSEFSGGQLTKLAFIKLLLSKPDILLLDEPTNHLDMSTIAWLEEYLKNYNRAVVIVSHDRMFIDRIVNVVYEITYGTVTRYNGNYSDFVRIKKERYEKQLKDHIAQQKEIKRLEEIIEKFKNKPTKVAMTRSKLKAIEHMELVARPADYDTKSFQANYSPTLETGKDVLYVQDLEVGYDGHSLAKVSIDLKKGERLGIIGDNGIGKSTLLKTLVGDLPSIAGDFRFGVNVQIGYFDQRMAQYSSDKTVLDDYWDTYPTLTQTEVRNNLGAFLFTSDEVYKEVSMLSGGEKVRLALAKLFHEKPNVLILDEPTNHMDMIGKETLEAMLTCFAGTVIFVSHDRYFVKKVATQILDMRTDGVKLYPFGYEDYEEKIAQGGASGKLIGEVKSLRAGSSASNKANKEISATNPSSLGNGTNGNGVEVSAGGENATVENVKADNAAAATMTAQEAYLASKELDRKKRRIAKIEDEIAAIEEEIDKLKEELSDPQYASNYSKLSEIQDRIDEKEMELLEKMEQWEEESK